MSRVAVVGAGVAGLACARSLADGGLEAVVFDKGRRVGGRLNTRRQDGRQLDHGAQYVTAEDPRFAERLADWTRRGVLAPWRYRERRFDGPAFEDAHRERLVGRGSMRRLATELAGGLDVRTEIRVASLPAAGRGPLALADAEGGALGTFDTVVVTAPLAQARDLVVAYPSLAARLRVARHAPCWAIMLDFDDHLSIDADVITTQGSIAWAARERSKPGRPDSAAWIVHASPAFSAELLESDPEVVASRVQSELARLASPLPRVTWAVAHRWRYARVVAAVGEAYLSDASGAVIVAGDGLLGPKVEAAWRSGVAAAERVVERCAHAPTMGPAR